MPQQITVLTPEKVEITFRLGGLASRASALLLDLMLWLGLLILAMLGSLWIAAKLGLPENVADVVAVVILWAAAVGLLAYLILTTWLGRGQTIGKRVLGLRVVTTVGGPVPLHAAVLRSLLLVADVIPFLLIADALLLLLDPKCRRLGDMLAGTLVIVSRRPKLTQSSSARATNLLLSCVSSVSALNEDDLDAIDTLLHRYGQLPEVVRDQLVHEIWQAIYPRIQADFPEEVTLLQRLQTVAVALERDLERR